MEDTGYSIENTKYRMEKNDTITEDEEMEIEKDNKIQFEKHDTR